MSEIGPPSAAVDPADLIGRRVRAVIIGWHVFEGERSQQQLFLRFDDGTELEANTHDSGQLVFLRRGVPDDFSMDEYGSFEFRAAAHDHPATALLHCTIDAVERIIHPVGGMMGLRLTTSNGTVVLINDFDDLFVSNGELPPFYRDARIE